MDKNSIVAIRNLGNLSLTPFAAFIKWLPIQDEKTPYVVRDIIDGGVVLQEGIIGVMLGSELALRPEYVIELLPPEDISEEIKEIQVNSLPLEV